MFKLGVLGAEQFISSNYIRVPSVESRFQYATYCEELRDFLFLTDL